MTMLGYTVIPITEPAAGPPEPIPLHAGVCTRCHFDTDVDDVWLAFQSDAGKVICTRCFRWLCFGETPEMSKRLRAEAAAAMGV